MQKILYICEAMGGGVRRHLVDLLANVDQNSFEIYVIYSENRADDVFMHYLPEFKAKGIVFYNLPELQRELSLHKDLACFKQILTIFKQIKPDIVHCHSSKAGALGRFLKLYRKNIKVFYTPHAYFSQNQDMNNLKKKVFVGIERFLSTLTDKTFNVSIGENEYAKNSKIVKNSNSVVIYNGINELEQSILATDSSKEKFIIGSVARVDNQKDPFTFINIAKRVVEKFNHVEFVYVGSGPMLNEVKNQIQSWGLETKIKFIGFHSKPLEVVKTFDLYLATSLYEGLPYSVIEAMSLRKPLILSDVIGHNELVLPSVNGELFKVKSVEEAVQKIENILNQPELMNLYADNSYELYREKYTLTKMISEIQKVYTS